MLANLLEKKPGSYLKDIMLDLEKKILANVLDNDINSLKEYIINNYN